MKKQNLSKWVGSLLVLLFTTTLFHSQEAKAENLSGISFQVFYDELMPYGDWVQDARNGYIWLPTTAGPNFHPYGTQGHWAMTEFGNTWVSYYDWGWAPFHYGRWYFDDFYRSWAWVPGYEWGPAWVNWRTGGGYYGWAPLRPGFSISIGFNIPSFHFVFLPRNRIYNHYAYRYFAPRRNRIRIYNNTTIINNTVVYNNNRYVAGPSRREVERVTRRAVPVYRTQNTGDRGRRLVAQNGRPVYNGRASHNATTRASRNSNTDVRSSREASPRSRNLSRPSASKPSLENQSRSNRSLENSTSRNGNPRFETRPYNESNRSSTRTSSSRSSQAQTRTQPRASKPQVRSSSRSADSRVNSSNRNSSRVQSPQRSQRKPAVSSGRTKARSSSSRPAVNSSSKRSSSSGSRVQSSTPRRSTQKAVKPASRSTNTRTAPKATKSKATTSRSRTSGRGN